MEIKQDLEFITEGLSARALGNTTRESFFNVSRGYRPFYYSLASYDAQIDEYSLFALNPNDGSEFLEYDEGNKDVATAFYAEAAINYNRTFNQKHTTTAMLVFPEGLPMHMIVGCLRNLISDIMVPNVLQSKNDMGFSHQWV
mgnify:CR=1 FL=1